MYVLLFLVSENFGLLLLLASWSDFDSSKAKMCNSIRMVCYDFYEKISAIVMNGGMMAMLECAAAHELREMLHLNVGKIVPVTAMCLGRG